MGRRLDPEKRRVLSHFRLDPELIRTARELAKKTGITITSMIETSLRASVTEMQKNTTIGLLEG